MPLFHPSLKARALALIGCIALICVGPKTAHAAALSVEWDPASLCPRSDVLERRVADLLGKSPESLLKEDLAVRLAFAADAASGVSLTVRTLAGQNSFERTLTAPTCPEAGEAAALVIAIAIDPNAVEQTHANEESGSKSPIAAFPLGIPPAQIAPIPAAAPPVAQAVFAPPVPARQVVTPIRPNPNPKSNAIPESSPVIVAEIGALLDVGTLPKIAPGFGAAVGLGISSVQLRLGALFLPPVSTAIPSSPKGTLQVSLLAGQARACLTTEFQVAHGAACLGFEAGQFSAKSRDVSSPGTGSELWLAGLLGAEVELDLLRDTLGIWFRPELVVPFSRRGFAVAGRGRVFVPSIIEGRGAMGLRVAF